MGCTREIRMARESEKKNRKNMQRDLARWKQHETSAGGANKSAVYSIWLYMD